MNKNLYILLILFLGLSAASILLQGFIGLQIGPQIFFLDSYNGWFLVMNFTSLAGSILLLKYYHYRKYRWLFITATIATVSNVCLFTLIFIILAFKKWAGYYTLVYILATISIIVYATSLVFLRAEKAFWLKIAGMGMLFIGLLLLFTTLFTLAFPVTLMAGAIEQINLWASLFASIISVLFIMHFLHELSNVKTNNTDRSTPKWVENVCYLTGLVSFVFTLSFGILISSESYSSIYWSRQNYNRTKELAQLFERRAFVNRQGNTLLYQLLKPLDYDVTRKYPLVVSLPYGGQPGTDTIKQIEGACAAEVLSTDSNRKKYPAFILIPHLPAGADWSDIANAPVVDSLVYEAITSLDSQFAIDAKRRYVTGVSRGGYGSWHFISSRPDLFAAAIPVCGGGNPALASKAAEVAVWAFHGRNDKNVPVSASRDMVLAIENAGGHPKYTEYPDEAHNIWEKVKVTHDLWDWLFAQKQH